MDSELTLDSSQSSIVAIKLQNKENAPSTTSPLKSSQKPRRPPTVTPKRFSRFFTPRPSLLSEDEYHSRARRRLKDITSQVNNRQPVSENDFPLLRPNKRRKHSETVLSSPPQSSPIKFQPQRSPIAQIFEDTQSDSSSESDCCEPQYPARVKQLSQTSISHKILARSFGDYQTHQRGCVGDGLYAQEYASAANFCTQPNDIVDLRGSSMALAFCSVACNTNSLVAIGDEDGNVHMLDTAKSGQFSKPHLSFRVHRNAIMDMAFSPCDYVLATASGDLSARIIDMHTQQTLSMLAGHRASIKQIRFRPDNVKLLTTSGRDGYINIWDLRCSQRAVQVLKTGHTTGEDDLLPTKLCPYATMAAGPAHRATTAADPIVRYHDNYGLVPPTGVSITSIEHLPGSRSHLLLSASEQNASLKLFDLRVAGRNTKSDRCGVEIPVACTPIPSTQRRNFGVSALAISSDGSRAFSVCRDNTVWVYSTQHLIMGNASEYIDIAKRTRVSPPDKPKDGLAPLYGLRSPRLKVSSFYVRASLRKATPDHDEVLAVGSGDQCAVLFQTTEPRNTQHKDIEDIARPSWLSGRIGQAKPIYHNTGTGLVRGHSKEVTSLAFSHTGELVTTGDDFKVRCWREDREKARYLRQCGEGEGARWRSGWAEVSSEYDEDLE